MRALNKTNPDIRPTYRLRPKASIHFSCYYLDQQTVPVIGFGGKQGQWVPFHILCVKLARSQQFSKTLL